MMRNDFALRTLRGLGFVGRLSMPARPVVLLIAMAVMSGGFAIMGQTGTIFTGVIWLIIIALFLYSRSMASKGVLS